MMTYKNLINGAEVDGDNGTQAIFNPADGRETGQVVLSSAAIVDKAVAAAKAALPSWANTPPLKRARIMFAYKELLEKNLDAMAEAVSRQHGKIFEDARGEVIRGIEVVEFICGIPYLLQGDYSRNVGSAIDSCSDRQPLGIAAGITPFNFPAMVPMWMFPMAIACGNCFILKPSERDPAAPLLAAELLHQAGLPNGVMNIVQGGKEAVDGILAHPDIKAVSFVGSTPIAEYVYQTGTANGKRVQALGGAKNHMVIMPDADMDQAVDALMGAAFGSAGERCMAISIAVPVGAETADKLVQKLKPRIEAVKVGPWDDPDAEMGPLITKAHLDKVTGYIEAGIAEKAELVVDGRGFRLQGYEGGYFIGGSLFDHVTSDMSIYKEEIFGPVLGVVRTDSFNDAVQLVNDHEYGNGTAIFTRDGDAARAYADQVEIGMVGVNVPIPVPVAYHSFGGWKRSIFGDHGAYGMEAVRFYTRLKTVTSRWPNGVRSGAQFNFPLNN